MEFTYENQGINTYLCCELTDMEIDTMGLGMITNNHIQGFVPSVFTQMNGRKFMKYNVSSKVSMKQLFSGQINRKRLVSVFAGIADMLIQAEEYMLDVNSIILDMEYVFINIPDCTAEVIYVPAVFENGSNQEVAMFFKNIMFSTQFDASENCDYVAEIINCLNRADTFAIPQFRKLLENLKKQPQERVCGEEEVRAIKSRNISSAVNGKEDRVVSERAAEDASGQRSIPDNVAGSGMAAQMSIQNAEQAPSNSRVSGVPQIPTAGAPIPQMQIPGGYNIPNASKKETAAAKQESSEKQISLFYLLQHYNKENAELYKAQKEDQKQKSGELPEKQQKPANKKEKKSKEKQQKSKKADVPVNYAVPGQQSIPAVSVQHGQASPGEQMQPVPCLKEKVSVPSAVERKAAFKDNFGETEYMSQEDDGGTVLMGEGGGAREIQPYLIRLKNNERIPLGKNILSIGRDKDLVDYAIPDNRFVGHYHCHILLRDGEIFIVDNNSKNHTYVNGTEIQSNTEVKLSHSTIFSVANEEFEVRLY